MPSNTLEYNQQYYLKNKEHIKSQMSVKDECPICGKRIVKQYLSKHMKTSRCKADDELKELIKKTIQNFQETKNI